MLRGRARARHDSGRARGPGSIAYRPPSASAELETALDTNAYGKHYRVEDRHWWYRGRWAVVSGAALTHGAAGDATDPRRRLRHRQLPPALLRSWASPLASIPRRRPLASATSAASTRSQQAGLEQLPFEDDSFDLICATDVLEHIAAEHEALRELRRVAAPNAVLLLTVPAYMWLWSDEDVHLHHQRRYTRGRLREAVIKAGWTPQVSTYFNSLLLPPIALARKLPQKDRRRSAVRARAHPGWLNSPLSLPMRLEARLIKAGASLPAGVSVGIVCRKPA